MLRATLNIACVLTVFVCAVWAYQENIKTRASIKQLEDVERQIARETNRIEMLRAEWAYLNRPARLERLVAMIGGDPVLTPIADTRFGAISQIELRPVVEPGFVALDLRPRPAGGPS